MPSLEYAEVIWHQMLSKTGTVKPKTACAQSTRQTHEPALKRVHPAADFSVYKKGTLNWASEPEVKKKLANII